MDVGTWQSRLDELIAAHDVPGASVAVLRGDEVRGLASGVLHRGTGVEATPDSLFQVGSITKVYTATVVLRLVEQGRITLDTPVVQVLPRFRVADPDVTARITVRHLLTHTSGIDGDFFRDTGRGDDCLARYVDACAELAACHPPGAAMSYCNSGYSILGRVVEVLTGRTWDEALRELLLSPLGLTATHTLPEEVLRYRAALGHEAGPDGEVRPVAVWGLPRSAGPAGTVAASAAEVLELARLHLRGGLAPDGTRLLAADTVARTRATEVAVPVPWGKGDRWGLGWALFDWGGSGTCGHDGMTLGQMASLRVVPGAGVAVVVMANSDRAALFLAEATAELVQRLTGLAVPPPFGPPSPPAEVGADDLRGLAGVYERAAVRFEAGLRHGGLVLREVVTDELGIGPEEAEIALTPVTGTLFAGRSPLSGAWTPFRFLQLPDGRWCLHAYGRVTPRVRGGAV
jgi:CubicO group peptidase (beta-lactamase class C family)